MANMAVIGNVLFYKVDLSDYLRRLATDELWQEVNRLQDGDFAMHPDEKLVEQVVAKASRTPLEVVFDKTTAVDVTGRFDHDRGFRITKAIPFKGDRQLWDMKPNPRGMNPPHGEIRVQELIIGIKVAASEKDQLVQYIDGVVAKLREHLGYQAEQLQQHNDSLPDLALPLVQRRRVHFAEAADIRKRLNKED